ncbi:MAG: ester cyclase [Candidatus Kapaibacterium sp.]
MKSRLMIVAACAVLVLAGCAKKDAGASADAGMSARADSMKAAYTAMSVAWDAGKTDEFGKYVAADMKEHDLMPGGKPGLEGMQEMAKMMKVSFPDMKSTIEDMRVDGDVLTVRFKASGTNSGPMMGGMPATNKKMDGVEGIEMMRWQNGKFVEHWGVFDAMHMMMQLGMMPPMPGSGAPPAGDMKPMDKMGGDKKKM